MNPRRTRLLLWAGDLGGSNILCRGHALLRRLGFRSSFSN